MYSIFLHAHQKLDRVAFRRLRELRSTEDFPTIRQILHFEGQNGPDSSKLKRGEYNEQPWHFYDPFDPEDSELIETIEEHAAGLARELKRKDMVRAAFEASWLAHAIVDGLTPAHHYPYEAELERLRGEDRHTRINLRSRLVVRGDTASESVKRSIKLMGPKGLLTTHTLFEAGAASIILPLRLGSAAPTEYDLKTIKHIGLSDFYKRLAREVALLNMYEDFYRLGWSPNLALQVRRELAPRMAKMITLAWYDALQAAQPIRTAT